jgi:hypothetical protein
MVSTYRDHYDPNQPRIPAGDPSHHGGRWTTDGASIGGSAAMSQNWPITPVRAQRQTSASSPGFEQEVVLPDGTRVRDLSSISGYLMSPTGDLRPVAEAGRRTGAIYRQLVLSPYVDVAANASVYLAISFYLDVGTGGRFDYQRGGNQMLGTFAPNLAYTQYRDYRNVSNFNVGLYCQQAGLSIHETLSVAGTYASLFSSNHAANMPYGLDPVTAEFIAEGFAAGKRGIFDQLP